MAELTVAELTTKTIDGDGVFDCLMQAASVQLTAEYNAGRIDKAEYATVYLGMMDGVLNSSMTFLLERKKVELYEQQILKAEQDVALAAQQVINLKCEEKKCAQEILLLEGKVSLIPQEKALMEAQVTTAQKDIEVKTAQISKIATEETLIEQKRITEVAQISNDGVDADSVVGKQNALYQAQTDGYLRDAILKVAKLYADTWIVRRTTDDVNTQATEINKLEDENIGAAMDKLADSISVVTT